MLLFNGLTSTVLCQSAYDQAWLLELLLKQSDLFVLEMRRLTALATTAGIRDLVLHANQERSR
jgi:hypothetical protein